MHEAKDYLLIQQHSLGSAAKDGRLTDCLLFWLA